MMIKLFMCEENMTWWFTDMSVAEGYVYRLSHIPVEKVYADTDIYTS